MSQVERWVQGGPLQPTHHDQLSMRNSTSTQFAVILAEYERAQSNTRVRSFEFMNEWEGFHSVSCIKLMLEPSIS